MLLSSMDRGGVGHMMGSILFANHKANGVVTNIGFLGDTVDDTGSYMAV